MLQCHHVQLHRGYSTGNIAKAVVSISQRCGDCWSLLLIRALTTRSSDRRVLGSFLDTEEGKLGHLTGLDPWGSTLLGGVTIPLSVLRMSVCVSLHSPAWLPATGLR